MGTEFTPTKWEPVEAKLLFEKQFKRLANGGFRSEDFPKTFYQRLCNCFGFIAHYDRHGFYSVYFTEPADIVTFLEAVLDYPCYGDPAFTYSDVERVLQEWVRSEGLLELWREKAASRVTARERMELARLQAKYGIS